MKKLMTLLVGAVLLGAMSFTSLNASDMKCGAGKCGAAMKAPVMGKKACCQNKTAEMKKPACCEAKAVGNACKCDRQVKCTCKDASNCTCAAGKKVSQTPKAAMKCGKGKCS